MRRRTAGLKGVQGEEGVSPNSLADFFHWIPDLVKASSAKNGFRSCREVHHKNFPYV